MGYEIQFQAELRKLLHRHGRLLDPVRLCSMLMKAASQVETTLRPEPPPERKEASKCVETATVGRPATKRCQRISVVQGGGERWLGNVMAVTIIVRSATAHKSILSTSGTDWR